MYLIKVEAHFDDNRITSAAQKRALLVWALGTKAIGVLSASSAPANVSEFTYDETVKHLDSYFTSKSHEIAESSRFYNRRQGNNETVHDFLMDLRRIVDNCNFGLLLNRMLRDRLVCGLRNKKLQQTLLARRYLTLDSAVDMADATEVATKESTQMGKPERGLQKMTAKGRRTSQIRSPSKDQEKVRTSDPCYRCGKAWHLLSDCRFRKRYVFAFSSLHMLRSALIHVRQHRLRKLRLAWNRL